MAYIFHVPNLIDELGTAEERRMNQLRTAEFGAAKVRHKFGRACGIMRRWSDIDSENILQIVFLKEFLQNCNDLQICHHLYTLANSSISIISTVTCVYKKIHHCWCRLSLYDSSQLIENIH
jgi:hypothetical protein